jgi:hypothetical protein
VPVAVLVALQLADELSAAGSQAGDDGEAFESGGWSRHSDLNRGPAVYETAALPLSYVGWSANIADAFRQQLFSRSTLNGLWQRFGRTTLE